MSRFDDDIRRIAKRDKIKGALESKLERDPIFGTATPFITDAFEKDESFDSSDTLYVAVDDEISTIYPEQYGGTSNPGLIRGDGFSGDGFSEDSKDACSPRFSCGGGNIDDVPKANEFYNQEAGPINLPNGSSYKPLTGLDGLYDCNTNDEYKVRFNGRHAEVNGWDDPAVPPGDPTWIQGTFWKDATKPEPVQRQYASRGAVMAESEFLARSNYFDFFDNWAFHSFTSGWYKIENGSWAKNLRVRFPAGFMNGSVGDMPPLVVSEYSCDILEEAFALGAPSDFGSSYCPDTRPLLEECWGCGIGRTAPTSTSLVYKDGTYQTSEYDSNAKNEFNGRSVIELCGELDGQKRIQIEPSFDGGQIITAGNITKVISPDGRLIFAGDATESNKNAYRPPAI